IVLRKMAQAIERHPQAFGRLLCAADFYVGPVKELVVIGDLDQNGTQALIRAAHAKLCPNLTVVHANGNDPHSGIPLLEGRNMQDGKPTAYLCEGYACK